LAISKNEKAELVQQYKNWIENSDAAILAEYTGLSVKGLDELRSKLREIGSEFHVIKNTLGKRAFSESGYEINDDWFTGSTALGLAFEDAPATAKILRDFAKTAPSVKIKAGYLGKQQVDSDGVRALADLPPLPVMRAILLGTISAPASKLVRTLAEPGRQIAAVIKAYSDQNANA
jgi:large subunit ribosomal protein L10